MIQDPGAGLETRQDRRAARQVMWVPWWENASAAQKKNIVWDAFLDFYGGMTAERKFRLKSKVRAAMDDPDATLAEMKDYIYSTLSTRELLRVMEWLS